MQFVDDRNHLRVEIRAKECRIPEDERARMQPGLEHLREAVAEFPQSHLRLTFIYHPDTAVYHAEARLQLPGQTLFTGDRDAYLDSAFHRCLRKLTQKVADYKDHPNREALAQTERRQALDRATVAPEDPAAGPLGEAVLRGDYRTFRTSLSGYEEWLRKRVGRWVQRYPEAEARIGRGLAIGDLVEEVYLNAFERFDQRPTNIRLSEWLERLIEPSLQMMMEHPAEEHENTSLARTWREMPNV